MAAVVSSDARVSGDADDTAAGADDVPVSEAEKTRQEEPVQSNQIPGWPQGPVISAETAILLDADTVQLQRSARCTRRRFQCRYG